MSYLQPTPHVREGLDDLFMIEVTGGPWRARSLCYPFCMHSVCIHIIGTCHFLRTNALRYMWFFVFCGLLTTVSSVTSWIFRVLPRCNVYFQNSWKEYILFFFLTKFYFENQLQRDREREQRSFLHPIWLQQPVLGHINPRFRGTKEWYFMDVDFLRTMNIFWHYRVILLYHIVDMPKTLIHTF